MSELGIRKKRYLEFLALNQWQKVKGNLQSVIFFSHYNFFCTFAADLRLWRNW